MSTRKQLLLATAMTLVVLSFAVVGYAGYFVYAAFLASPYYQSISGPVRIGSEWVEITPPEPLKSVNVSQYVQLKVQGIDNWEDDFKTVKFENGQTGRVEAYLFDDKGEAYELAIYGTGGVGGGLALHRKKPPRSFDDPPTLEPDFPRDKKYTKLRIRSDITLESSGLRWVCTNPK